MAEAPARQAYFQRPLMLLGILFILGGALYGGLVYPKPTRVSGLAGTVTAESGTGKAVNAPGGLYNPVPLGIAYIIADGRFQVNSLQRNMSAAVREMNTFNREPALGEEWIVLNVTFFCELQAEALCNTYNLDFEVQGSGRVYNDNFVILLDDKFTGSIPGGGERAGNIAFIVRQSDTELLLAVNDGSQRVYFKTT